MLVTDRPDLNPEDKKLFSTTHCNGSMASAVHKQVTKEGPGRVRRLSVLLCNTAAHITLPI
jgi:hypothetical protein